MRGCFDVILVISAILPMVLGWTSARAEEAAPVQLAAYTEETALFREIPSVYGASKYEQKVTEAPSSVSIVTAEEIKKYGYRTLADILKSVRSFYVTYDRNYSYVGVRGFGRPGDYNSRILLLVDGHRTNENVYDGAYVGTDAVIDVDLIDRVEIIRGPGSSLYGSNAFFSVVNIITKRGRNLKGAEVSVEAGSFGAYKGRASYGGRFQSGVEAVLSGTIYDSTGDRLYFREFDPAYSGDVRAANNGITDRTDYDRYGSFFSTIAYGDLTFQGAHVSRTKGIPTGAFATDFNNPANKTEDTRSYGELRYEHGLGARTDIAARLYYDYYKYTGDYAYYADPAIATLNKDSGYGTWWGGELKLITRPRDENRLIAGIEFQGNQHQDQKTYYVDPYSLDLDDLRSSRLWAAYLQDELSLSKAMILNAGVRYDYYGVFGGTTNPRLAFLFAPDEKSAVKLLAGSAFRAPNVFELYYTSVTNEPNPALEPEKITTYELVYEQYFSNSLRAAVGGYYYTIKDLINQVETAPGITSFRNIDSVTARGGELEIENKWAQGIEGKFSYTIQRAEDKLTGEPLTNSPAQLAKLAVTVPLFSRNVLLGVEEQAMSRRRTVNGNYAGGFAVTNVTLFSRVLNRFEASVGVYNLFDKEYADPVSADLLPLDTVRQDGRSCRVKLVYSF